MKHFLKGSKYMESLGRHILVEYYNCSSEVLNDVIMIENAMVKASEAAGATVINSTFHHFSHHRSAMSASSFL